VYKKHFLCVFYGNDYWFLYNVNVVTSIANASKLIRTMSSNIVM